MAQLKIREKGETTTLPLEEKPLILGRDSERYPILDQGVSRKHAEVFRKGEMYFIRDLGSRNGTFVNDERVEDEWLLRAGDRIHLGNTVLVFEDAASTDSRVIKFGDIAEKPGSTVGIQDHERLEALYEISRYLGTGETLPVIMEKISESMSRALNADHVYIFAFEDPETGDEFRLVAAYDRRPVDGLSVSRSTLRRVRDEGQPILSSDAMLDERFSASKSVVLQQIKSLMCVPVSVMNHKVGAFYFSNSKHSEVFSTEDLEFATITGMLVGNALEMWEVLENQSRLYRSVLKTLSSVAERRIPEHRGSSERVATYSSAIARALGFPNERIRLIWVAGLLHDIGAIALTENELANAVNLEERKAKMAGELLEKIDGLERVTPIIRQHTERLDGSGFPEGKSGDDLAVEAQIVGLACVFDELLNYGGEDGGPVPVKEALVRLRDEGEGKFLPSVINGLLIAYRRGILFVEDEKLFAPKI